MTNGMETARGATERAVFIIEAISPHNAAFILHRTPELCSERRTPDSVPPPGTDQAGSAQDGVFHKENHVFDSWLLAIINQFINLAVTVIPNDARQISYALIVRSIRLISLSPWVGRFLLRIPPTLPLPPFHSG